MAEGLRIGERNGLKQSQLVQPPYRPQVKERRAEATAGQNQTNIILLSHTGPFQAYGLNRCWQPAVRHT